MNIPKAHLLLCLFLTIVADTHGGSECDKLVQFPWICLTVSAHDLHQNAPTTAPRRTFTILLCSGPQCTESIRDGPHSFGHHVADRLVLFHANSNPTVSLTLPTGWLGEIRARDIEIIGTLLAPHFLSLHPFTGQGTFLSKLVLRQCGLKGTVSTGEPSSAEEHDATNDTRTVKTVDDDTPANNALQGTTDDKGATPFERLNQTSTTNKIPKLANATSHSANANSHTRPQHQLNSLLIKRAASSSNYEITKPAESPPEDQNPEEPRERRFNGSSTELRGATTVTGPVFLTQQLSHLSLLRHLDLSGNELESLARNAFPGGLKELRTLDLSRNAIREVETDALHSLSSLNNLNLSHNRLAAVQRGMFNNPDAALEKLDFSWNFLTDLPEDMFKDMYALREVRLADNYLQRLPAKVWMPVWNQLTVLSLTGNFIACECDAAWLGDKLAPHAVVDGVCSYPEEREGVRLKDFKRPPRCN